jgi:hypothetical protein
MAKYRVLEKSFINNILVNTGDVVEVEGEPSGNLELVVEPAKGKKSAPAPEADALV